MKKFAIVVFSLWVLLACGRLFNNYYALIKEEGRFFFLTDNERREELFECYPLVQKINSVSASPYTLVYYGNDGFCFFTLRYYLYPNRVIFYQGHDYEEGNNEILVSQKELALKSRKLSAVVQGKVRNYYIYK